MARQKTVQKEDHNGENLLMITHGILSEVSWILITQEMERQRKVFGEK